MYVRKKVVKGKEYYQIVEGNLKDGKVRQSVLFYIGDLEKLKKLYESIGKRLEFQQSK